MSNKTFCDICNNEVENGGIIIFHFLAKIIVISVGTIKSIGQKFTKGQTNDYLTINLDLQKCIIYIQLTKMQKDLLLYYEQN